jgi:hypothetical protein
VCKEPWLDQAGVSVGVVTSERTPCFDEPRTPVRVLRVDISRYQEAESSVEALGQVGLDQGSYGRVVGRHELHWSGWLHNVCGSSLQMLQT